MHRNPLQEKDEDTCAKITRTEEMESKADDYSLGQTSHSLPVTHACVEQKQCRVVLSLAQALSRERKLGRVDGKVTQLLPLVIRFALLQKAPGQRASVENCKAAVLQRGAICFNGIRQKKLLSTWTICTASSSLPSCTASSKR
jgi:hypothetical protein